MADIESRNDLEFLLAHFYERLLADHAISHIFTDVAKIDLPSHLPAIVDFWQMALFGTGGYRNNVMTIHAALHNRARLEKKHFEVWLAHLNASIDGNFRGAMAELMKTRALSIAMMMQIKLDVHPESGIER